MKRWFTGFLGLLAAVSLAADKGAKPVAPAASQGPVYVMTVTGAIDPVVSRYLKDGLNQAADAGAQMALIRLDTPGGLLDATRDIVQDILNAPLPVVMYVSPRGARATSAGVFMMMAADVAAMAPETHIGAAHPVSLGGGMGGEKGESVQKSSAAVEETSVMGEKAVSDAAAYIRALARERQRNADWAEKAVRESLSLTADEAYDKNVIDVVAADEAELFELLAQGTVEKDGREYALAPAGAPRVDVEMAWHRRVLHALAHPNIAYILLMIGVYALLYEFVSPGIGFGGVTGIICLVLAFFSLQMLPLNYAGLALLIAGIAMMAADHAVGGHGLLMTGGIVSFAVGSFMLYDRAEPYFRVNLSLIAGSVAAGAGFSLVVVKAALAIRGMKPVTGRESLIGKTAEVREDGLAFLDGQLWTVDGYGPFEKGEKVRVADVEGNKLIIEKL
jgi:membrane-bound serine protease (ClpP class)